MRRRVVIAAVIVAIPVVAFAYYAISPLFRTITANDALPAGVQSDPSPSVEVIGTAGHPASGSVRIVEAGGVSFVRYENFKTINGPDIYVYLAKDLDAKEFVSLGKVKATEGNVNYEIPAGVDVSAFPYVLTWCKQFGVLFNYAEVGSQKSGK